MNIRYIWMMMSDPTEEAPDFLRPLGITTMPLWQQLALIIVGSFAILGVSVLPMLVPSLDFISVFLIGLALLGAILLLLFGYRFLCRQWFLAKLRQRDRRPK